MVNKDVPSTGSTAIWCWARAVSNSWVLVL